MTSADYETLKTLVEAASLGVSADNGQPWSFRWLKSQLYLTLDRQRAQSYFDRKQFAAVFALGSVLENLSIAAAHLGYILHVGLPTHDQDEGLTLHLRIGLRFGQTAPHPLYPEIARRATNRRPYKPTPVPVGVRNRLMEPFHADPTTRLLFLDTPEQIHTLARLTVGADRIRFDFSSPAIHGDFFKCLRFTKQEAMATRDGLWLPCLEVKPPDRLALRVLSMWGMARLARHLGVAHIFANQTVSLLRRTPLVALIIGRSAPHSGTATGGTMSTDGLFLQGGRLCQRLWLVATSHGLACQPMAVLPLFFAQFGTFGEQGFPGGHGVTVRQIKKTVYEQFGLGADEHLMMVLRLGYAAPPSARSFRRPANDLLTIEDDSPLGCA